MPSIIQDSLVLVFCLTGPVLTDPVQRLFNIRHDPAIWNIPQAGWSSKFNLIHSSHSNKWILLIFYSKVANVCSQNPNLCSSHGTCTPVFFNSYMCTCNSGYTGVHCQTCTNPCDKPNQRLNSGTCSSSGCGNFTCKGAVNFAGDRCQYKSQPCLGTSPCLNNGTCVPGSSPGNSTASGPYTCTHVKRVLLAPTVSDSSTRVVSPTHVIQTTHVWLYSTERVCMTEWPRVSTRPRALGTWPSCRDPSTFTAIITSLVWVHARPSCLCLSWPLSKFKHSPSEGNTTVMRFGIITEDDSFFFFPYPFKIELYHYFYFLDANYGIIYRYNLYNL